MIQVSIGAWSFAGRSSVPFCAASSSSASRPAISLGEDTAKKIGRTLRRRSGTYAGASSILMLRIGVAASQIGPDAQAAIVHLNKVGGLSQGKIAEVFDKLFGVKVTRGGVCQAMLRVARRCQPHYQQLVASVGQAALEGHEARRAACAGVSIPNAKTPAAR